MWPFFLERTITFSKRMPATVAQVCDILLNADSFVRLNPYVIKVVQDPTNPQRYEIVDRLPGPGTWKYESSIHAIFTPMEDESGKGVDVAVTLPQSSRFLFPKMHNKYRVQETENAGIVQVTEVVRLRALFLLVPYILNTLTKAHKQVLDRLADRVEDAQRVEGLVQGEA